MVGTKRVGRPQGGFSLSSQLVTLLIRYTPLFSQGAASHETQEKGKAKLRLRSGLMGSRPQAVARESCKPGSCKTRSQKNGCVCKLRI